MIISKRLLLQLQEWAFSDQTCLASAVSIMIKIWKIDIYTYCTLEKRKHIIISFVGYVFLKPPPVFFKNQHVMSIMHLLVEGILQLLSPSIFPQLYQGLDGT